LGRAVHNIPAPLSVLVSLAMSSIAYHKADREATAMSMTVGCRFHEKQANVTHPTPVPWVRHCQPVGDRFPYRYHYPDSLRSKGPISKPMRWWLRGRCLLCHIARAASMWYDRDIARTLCALGSAGPCREEKGDVHTTAGNQTRCPTPLPHAFATPAPDRAAERRSSKAQRKLLRRPLCPRASSATSHPVKHGLRQGRNHVNTHGRKKHEAAPQVGQL
jgi:hypothetical protein